MSPSLISGSGEDVVWIQEQGGRMRGGGGAYGMLQSC